MTTALRSALLQEGGFDGPGGSDWDGRTINLGITAGANILDDRGNVTAFFVPVDPAGE